MVRFGRQDGIEITLKYNSSEHFNSISPTFTTDYLRIDFTNHRPNPSGEHKYIEYSYDPRNYYRPLKQKTNLNFWGKPFNGRSKKRICLFPSITLLPLTFLSSSSGVCHRNISAGQAVLESFDLISPTLEDELYFYSYIYLQAINQELPEPGSSETKIYNAFPLGVSPSGGGTRSAISPLANFGAIEIQGYLVERFTPVCGFYQATDYSRYCEYGSVPYSLVWEKTWPLPPPGRLINNPFNGEYLAGSLVRDRGSVEQNGYYNTYRSNPSQPIMLALNVSDGGGTFGISNLCQSDAGFGILDDDISRFFIDSNQYCLVYTESQQLFDFLSAAVQSGVASFVIR